MPEPGRSKGTREQTVDEFERMLHSRDFATIDQLTGMTGLTRLADGARSVDDLGAATPEGGEQLPRRR
jgi:hypothetical protein